MAKKAANKKAPKGRVSAIKIGRLVYEATDLRIGDQVTFEGAWKGKQVGNRKFKVIDIESVVVVDAEGRTDIMRAADLMRVSD